jgi:hypothetical protein
MNQLTTPITIPNIQKMHVAAVQLDGDNLVANVTVVVQGTGNIVYGTPYQLAIRDGVCQGIRATVSPLGYSDRVEVFTSTVASGFTNLVAAYTGAIAARNSAVETMLIAAGLMPAGTVT